MLALSDNNQADVIEAFNPTSRYPDVLLNIDIPYFEQMVDHILSYDVGSGSEITSCNKICKPLVVYRFTGNVMTSITTLRTK